MSTPTTISVRGTATRTVAPDYATVACSITAVPADREVVVSSLHAGQQDLVERLGALGGVVLSVDSERAELTWSFGGPQVQEQYGHDELTREHGPTGRFTGDVSVSIVLRSLERLSQLADTLLSSERLGVDRLQWLVDADNPAWRDVRADAIISALAKADDYAVALGGVVQRVEHVADAGLLAGTGEERPRMYTESATPASAVLQRGGNRGTSVLDPVPQRIQAIVEARVLADLPSRPLAN